MARMTLILTKFDPGIFELRFVSDGSFFGKWGGAWDLAIFYEDAGKAVLFELRL